MINIYANTFYGALSGNATTATTASSATNSKRLEVIDNRGSDVLPNSYDSNRVTSFFNSSTPLGDWASGITIAG